RYRVFNLALIGIAPGPREPDSEQLQRFLRPFVDDLLRLWKDGITIQTQNHPQGRLVRVALVAIVCDHPALCKMSGFGDQAHAARPCTQCEIRRKDIPIRGWDAEGIPLRNGELHKRRAAQMYDRGPHPPDKEYFKQYGVRWTEFARLPYFDPIIQSVIDPMHSLLQGLTKTVWYAVWVCGGKDNLKVLRGNTQAGTRRELDQIHKILNTVSPPLLP
ncbi:hypothetical protein CALCODRAFT_435919, partial [Calocera cornea HHB12733]